MMDPKTSMIANLKLLVIDNSTAEKLILGEAFAEQSIPVDIEWIESGHAAITTFISGTRSEIPDVILVDYHLFGISGLDVIKELANTHKLEKVPIILISGMMDEALRERCKNMGVFDAREKPVHLKGYLALAQSLQNAASTVTTERFVKP